MAGAIPLGDGRSVRFDGPPPIWAWHDEVMGFQVTISRDGLVWTGDDLRGRTSRATQSTAQFFALGPNVSDLPDLVHEDLTRWLKARHTQHADAPELVWRWAVHGMSCSAAILDGRLVFEESDPKGGGGRLLQSFDAFFGAGPANPATPPGIVLRIADALRRRDPTFSDRATPFSPPDPVRASRQSGRARFTILGELLLLAAAIAASFVLHRWF